MERYYFFIISSVVAFVMVIRNINVESKYENVAHLLQYGIEDCMRLQCDDTPIFLAESSLLREPNLGAEKSKEKVCVRFYCKTILSVAGNQRFISLGIGVVL